MKRLPSEPLPLANQLAVAMVCTVTALLVRLALMPALDGGTPFITFFPAVVVATLWGGGLAGVGTSLLSSVLASVVLLPPYWNPVVTVAEFLSLLTFNVSAAVILLLAVGVRMLLSEARRHQAQSEVKAHELEHRIRNVYALVHAIYRQTSRSTSDPAEQSRTFEARLQALASAQELLTRAPGVKLSLNELITKVLAPFDCINRTTLAGPEIALPSDLGPTFGLILHELTTNALKYGCLSVPEGRVSISWGVKGNFGKLEWSERGGPPVTPPERKGFGSRLMTLAFGTGQGSAEIAYRPDGVHCKMVFPVLMSETEGVSDRLDVAGMVSRF